MAKSDESLRDLLAKFSDLKDADLDITWCAVLQSAILDLPLVEILKTGDFFLDCLVPARVASSFNLTPIEASSILLQKTQGYEDLVDTEIATYRGERRSVVQHMLSTPLEELVETRRDYHKRYLSFITQRVVDSQDPLLQKVWFEALITDGELRSREIERLIDSYSRRKERINQNLLELLVKILGNSSLSSDYVLHSAYEYSRRSQDFEFGDGIVSRILNSIEEYSQTAIHGTVLYILDAARNDVSKIAMQSDKFLRRIDFITFDVVMNRVSTSSIAINLLKAVRDTARKFPRDSDFFVLLSSYLVITEEISPPKVIEISEAARSFFSSSLFKDSIVPNQVMAENEVLLRTYMTHPEIYISFAQFLERKSPKKARMVEQLGRVLTDPEPRADELLKIALSPELFLLQAPSVAILAVASSEALSSKIRIAGKLLTMSLERGLSIPDHVTEKLLKAAARNLDLESAKQFFNDLLAFELFPLKSALLNRVASDLLMDGQRVSAALTLVRAMESADVPVWNSVRHLALNESVATGEHYEWGMVQGPEAEYWSQLAIIFDDVVHELNQPLLALSNWIEFLKLLESGAPGDRMAGLEGLEKAKSELASRMIHYQALTTGGTEPMWYRIDELLEQVLRDLQNQLTASKVEVKLETTYLKEGKWVFAPGFQIRLAIRNIVRNAINALENKLGKREINISLKNPYRTNSQVILMIDDNGPGIPPELQGSIFEKGFTTKLGRGLGLGLPLAATVVRGIGGTLKLQATSSDGSTFVIILPSATSAIEVDTTAGQVGIEREFDEDSEYLRETDGEIEENK
jgi:signal transduction histidine kinase